MARPPTSRAQGEVMLMSMLLKCGLPRNMRGLRLFSELRGRVSPCSVPLQPVRRTEPCNAEEIAILQDQHV